ncbi:MAG: transposase [Verrucomicrobia bacterium]|nr:transposase [Verrucomicrobiota bacterium]
MNDGQPKTNAPGTTFVPGSDAAVAREGTRPATAESNPTPRPKRLRRLTRVWADHNKYFLTFRVHDRRPVLANAQVDERIRRFIADSLEHYGVWVDCYMAMPDHLHLIVSMAPTPGRGTRPTTDVGPVPAPGGMAPGSATLGEWVKAFKAVVGRREFKWQSGFFDHVLRSDESASEKWDYIRMNPVRAGLVEKLKDWPYAGFFDPRTGGQL